MNDALDGECSNTQDVACCTRPGTEVGTTVEQRALCALPLGRGTAVIGACGVRRFWWWVVCGGGNHLTWGAKPLPLASTPTGVFEANGISSHRSALHRLRGLTKEDKCRVQCDAHTHHRQQLPPYAESEPFATRTHRISRPEDGAEPSATRLAWSDSGVSATSAFAPRESSSRTKPFER